MANSINAMTRHKLDVARTVDGFENILIKNITPSAAQEALFPNGGIYAGRCMSRAANGESELGVSGRRVPMWLYRDSNRPSAGYSDPQTVDDAPDLTVKDGREHVLLHYVGIEGMELITSEFIEDTGTPYALNQFLTAPAADDAAFTTDAERVAGAGVVTNDSVELGKTPVVGVVSELTQLGTYTVPMLSFFTLYRPPIEALADGIAEPTWQV